MNICFVHDGLFSATTRSARHVEALVRRFAAKGHGVSVVTTSVTNEQNLDAIPMLRIDSPSLDATEGEEEAVLDSISQQLAATSAQLLFAESLTPLSALAVKAARAKAVPTIVRVLEDKEGIVHEFGRGPKARNARKKIDALLENASLAAVTSARCAELLGARYDGPIAIIERCVDLNVFRAGRTTKRDRDAFLARIDGRDRPILLFACDHLREETFAGVLPLLSALRAAIGDLLFLIVGELENEEAFRRRAAEHDVEDLIDLAGPLTGRDFFAAYEAATLFLVPSGSLATGGELLEAMAMGLPVVCFEDTAMVAGSSVVKSGCLILTSGEPEDVARPLSELLNDDARLLALREEALSVARSRDLMVAIDQVENLGRELLGVSEEAMVTDKNKTENTVTEKPKDEGRSRRRSRSAPKEEPARGATPDEQPKNEKAPAREEAPSEERVETVEVLESDSLTLRSRDRRRRRGRRGATDDVEELGATTGIDVLDVPVNRDRKRNHRLEPGLTLKDLMPFLRPPKTVLVIGASTGSGHARAAAALAEAFKAVDKNLIVRQADAIELIGKAYRPPFIRKYLDDLARNPALFGPGFETGDATDNPTLPAEHEEVLDTVFDKKLDEVVVDKRPDYLLCTHWLPLRRLAKLKESERLKAGVVAYVCDPALHDAWVSPVVSHYLVTDESMKNALLRRGVDALDISVVGYPVSPAFAAEPDRQSVLKELELDGNLPTLLVRPGGVGSTERILALAERLAKEAGPLNLVALVGKNDRLITELADLKVEGSRIRACGFVQNVRDLMGVADVLVTRASPHTLQESIAAGLPTILLRPTAGLEERFADRLTWANAALKAHGEEELVAHVTELFKNRRRIREMRDSLKALRRPDAATVAVERLSRLVR